MSHHYHHLLNTRVSTITLISLPAPSQNNKTQGSGFHLKTCKASKVFSLILETVGANLKSAIGKRNDLVRSVVLSNQVNENTILPTKSQRNNSKPVYLKVLSGLLNCLDAFTSAVSTTVKLPSD